MGCILNIPCEGEQGVTVDRFVKSEDAIGLTNCDNLTFSTIETYVDGTLEVYLDGSRLLPEQFSEIGDNQTFELVLDPENPNGLNKAPRFDERITVNYIKALDQQTYCVISI